jgi:hypothetical protein
MLKTPSTTSQATQEGWYYTRTTEHIPLLAKQLSDVPQLSGRIQRTKIINRLSVVNLIKDYNILRCDTIRCIVYKTNEPPLRVSLEPVAGCIRFRDIKRTFFQYGVISSFSFPNDNIKMQVRAGILFTRLDAAGLEKLYQFPLQLQYPFSYKKTTTRIHWGFNFWKLKATDSEDSDSSYWTYIWTSAVGTEFLYTIHKKLYASFGCGVETIPLTFIFTSYKPDSRIFNEIAASLNAGFGFQF